MKTYRFVIVYGGGTSVTQNIRGSGSPGGFEDALGIALKNIPYTNGGLISVTATII